MPSPELRRRVFLHLVAAGAVSSALATGCAVDEALSPAPVPIRFFSDEERRALGAIADHVLPPDGDPGGSALGVVTYIERLLTALEYDPPLLHAGGPFSGRQPYADPTGAPSSRSPENSFATFLPVDRVTLAGFRLELYGSAGVPGGGPNDAILGPVVGLRDLIQGELRDAMKASKVPLETLDDETLADLWNGFSQDFRTAFIELVAEGALSAPEYGGNHDLAGWRIASFGGDSLPLGYSQYDAQSGIYHERTGAPVSTADPIDPAPMDDETRKTFEGLVNLLGGKKFS